MDFDVRLRATGTYNMAFTMWVVSALPANRENISHEVMIWNATGHQRPAGTHSGVLEVDHVQYDVYVERAHGDASGRELSRWTYVAFVGRRPVFVGRLDLSAFLDDMLTRGLVSEDHYVTSVELGDEVSEGTGLAEVRRFSVVVGGR